ncbi:helix-turn-helix transcriptional regulator [Bauldia sp.]|uniref:helix-turn-helix transcriptional regulator n=1 Tax=Bauldia sp. TaxID=2575872 RepID=UPI003BA9BE60
MRRADRLFEIIQRLRGGRLVTAQRLAESLEVSVRTVYRDIRDLQTSGVPIDGAAGVGYLLRPGYHLPPLMFMPAEIEALIVGARMVEAWAGRSLANAATEALVKIGAVVPADRMRAAENVPIFAHGFRVQEAERRNLDDFASAIDERLKVRFAYQDATGGGSERTVWPLALHFWGKVWTLAAWCELRDDFRTFRVDRAEAVNLGDDRFPRVPGRTLEDYLARMTHEA